MAIRIVDGTTVATLASVINEHDGSIVTLQGEVALLPTDADVDAKIAEAGTGTGVALGDTSTTAYRGDRGKIAFDFSQNVIPFANRPLLLLQDGLVNKGTDEDPILGFDYDSEVFIAAVQAASGGTVLPTAPALTNVTDDDVNNIRTVVPDTDNGYTPSDVETSVDNGVTAATHTTNDFQIGNVELGIGVVKSRYKAIAGVRKAGPWFSNAVAYTESGTGGGNLIPYTQWIEWRGCDVKANTLEGTTGNMRARGQQYIAAGTDGTIEWGGDAAIAVDDHPEDITYGNGTDLNLAMYRSSANDKISTREGTTYADYGTAPSGTRLRFNFVGSNIIAQTKIPNATEWVDRHTFARIPGIDYYGKADSGFEVTDSVTNILTSNFSINTTLT